MYHDSTYAETCELHCTDKDQSIDSEVLNFHPGKYLDVSVNRELKIQLKYNKHHDLYIGAKAGLEFTTIGPKQFK
jgi:hypothetical protein